MNIWAVLKDFLKKNVLIKNIFIGTTNDKAGKLDGHITYEEYLTCIKI